MGAWTTSTVQSDQPLNPLPLLRSPTNAASEERLRGATNDLFELLERVQCSRLDDQRCVLPAYFSQVCVLKWNFPLWYNEIHSARTRVWCSWASANIFSRKNMHDFLIKERKMQKKRTKRDWVQHFSATITNDQCTCWRRAVTTRLTFSHLRPAFKVHFSFCLLFCARFQLWRSTRECNEHLHESAHANFSGRPTCFRL